MSMTATEAVLTKEDMSYLRRADDVYAINIDGQNYLRVVKRRPFGDEFADDKRVDIAVAGNGSDGWFVSLWGFPWHTLRAGDGVRFEWYPDAFRNEVLRNVGYHSDVLYLHIRKGKTWARYIGAVQTGPENSARMCKELTYRLA